MSKNTYKVAAMAVGPSNQSNATHSAVYAGLSGSGIFTIDPALPGFKIYLPLVVK
jgi:hypothetical protein